MSTIEPPSSAGASLTVGRGFGVGFGSACGVAAGSCVAASGCGVGCGDCRGTGYRGRIAIAEILVLNDPLRELIVNKASIVSIKAEARRGGTRLLRDAALDLAHDGRTTLEEVLRVTLQG